MKNVFVLIFLVFFFGQDLFSEETGQCSKLKRYISDSCGYRYYEEHNYTRAYDSYALDDSDIPADTNCVQLQVCSINGGGNNCHPAGAYECPARVDSGVYYTYYSSEHETYRNPITGAYQEFICCVGPKSGERPHGHD